HVAFTQAALGAKVEVETITGEKVKLDVPPGTQPGETLEIAGHGVPRLDGRGRGRLVCVIQIDVPKNLSAKAKKLLLELQDAHEPREPQGHLRGEAELPEQADARPGRDLVGERRHEATVHDAGRALMEIARREAREDRAVLSREAETQALRVIGAASEARLA